VSDSNKEEFTAQLKELADAIYAKVAQLGGDIGGEYGIGCGKLEAARANLSAEQQAAIKAQKQQLDPAGILNPGKVI
jgi:glycolate oxidase